MKKIIIASDCTGTEGIEKCVGTFGGRAGEGRTEVERSWRETKERNPIAGARQVWDIMHSFHETKVEDPQKPITKNQGCASTIAKTKVMDVVSISYSMCRRQKEWTYSLASAQGVHGCIYTTCFPAQ